MTVTVTRTFTINLNNMNSFFVTLWSLDGKESKTRRYLKAANESHSTASSATLKTTACLRPSQVCVWYCTERILQWPSTRRLTYIKWSRATVSIELCLWRSKQEKQKWFFEFTHSNIFCFWLTFDRWRSTAWKLKWVRYMLIHHVFFSYYLFPKNSDALCALCAVSRKGEGGADISPLFSPFFIIIVYTRDSMVLKA